MLIPTFTDTNVILGLFIVNSGKKLALQVLNINFVHNKVKRTIINIAKLFYSSVIPNNRKLNKLSSQWITGFCDGESSFIISIYKNKKLKTG